MKRIDASEQGIFEVSWSADGEWLAYVRNEDEVCIANVSTGELRILGKGASPGITANRSVVMERNNEIVMVSGGGEKVLVGLGDISKGSPKRLPVLSPDGSRFGFVINNVFDKDSQSKNAYPHRHFLGLGRTDGSKSFMTASQWYGGTGSWFPDGEHFAHFEFDSTGGARVHVLNFRGETLGTMFGLYPSVSPDSCRIACKPRNGGNVVVYTRKERWSEDDLETSVIKIPEGQGRLSGSPPQWLDNRNVLVDDGARLWRIDTRKDAPVEMKRLPQPAIRGTRTMTVSPSRELVAIEVPVGSGFELQVEQIAS